MKKFNGLQLCQEHILQKFSRKDPAICSWENPIALSTCDAFCVCTEHAEPVDAAILFSSSFMIRSSPLTPRNVKCILFGVRFSKSPLRVEPGISFMTLVTSFEVRFLK